MNLIDLTPLGSPESNSSSIVLVLNINKKAHKNKCVLQVPRVREGTTESGYLIVDFLTEYFDFG